MRMLEIVLVLGLLLLAAGCRGKEEKDIRKTSHEFRKMDMVIPDTTQP